MDIYKRPYDARRPVVCMDETNKQLVKETMAPIPASPGDSVRYDAEWNKKRDSEETTIDCLLP